MSRNFPEIGRGEMWLKAEERPYNKFNGILKESEKKENIMVCGQMAEIQLNALKAIAKFLDVDLHDVMLDCLAIGTYEFSKIIANSMRLHDALRSMGINNADEFKSFLREALKAEEAKEKH